MLRDFPLLKRRRTGAILPLVALGMLGLMGVLALAVDIGMIAVARCQCQNAADSAAMAGARTISGDAVADYNYAAVPAAALKAAVANKVFSGYVNDGKVGTIQTVNSCTYASGQVKIEIGAYAYHYNDSDIASEGFKLQIPRQDSAEPYSAVRATVQRQSDYFFGRVFGLSPFTAKASATAVHRPRDMIIIMDLSTSMRFQSLPGIAVNNGVAEPAFTNRPRTVSMNPESVYPKFGHYSATSLAALQGTSAYYTSGIGSGKELLDPANVSVETNSGAPVCADFYQNAAGVPPGPGSRAFARADDNYAVVPGGDDSLRTVNNKAGNPYAKTANEVFSGVIDKDLHFERHGYEHYVAKFHGYTQGPGYWGKTFFIWPPDPRGSVLDPANSANHTDNGAKDWRQRFFFKVNTASGKLGWLDHTNILFDPSGVPADNVNLTPGNVVLKTPGTATTVTEYGSSVSYTYRINYAAILHWLRNQSPKAFPNIVRAGRIKYYDNIPDPTKDAGLNSRWWTTATLSNLNERFWKTYIDFVLGLQGTGAGAYTTRNTDPSGANISQVPLSALIGNGDYFKWGTVKITQRPDVTHYQQGSVDNLSGYPAGTNRVNVKAITSVTVGHYVRFASHTAVYKIADHNALTQITLDAGLTTPVADGDSVRFYSTLPKSFDYDGNPHRPKHQFWFGPMTFVDFLGNNNTMRLWWPGNVHEAQAWACKVGIQTAISDIEKNHPNDFIGMTFFSHPVYVPGQSFSIYGPGGHNRAIVPLGRSYQQLIDSMWFPPSTVTGGVKEITPYDADFQQAPRASGLTSPGMGFMIAFNQLSSSVSNLRLYSQPQPQYRGSAGGLGRKGAQRVIIFETDGAPNVSSTALMGGTGKDSYYKIRVAYPADYKDSNNVEWPASGTFLDTDVFNVVKQICKLDTDNPPGYSTTRKPALVYPLAYGSLFDPANISASQGDALKFLQTVAYYGNTGTSTSGSDFPDSRRIYGTNQQRIDRMRQVFTDILQNGVQVSLIE
jgi:hypothetical protein